MTELTSQAYTRSLDGGATDLFVCPHWMRVRVLDPTSLEEAPPAPPVSSPSSTSPTSARCSTSSPRTSAGSEDGGFRLLGRASGAELRGCSLTAEELERPWAGRPARSR